MALSGRKLGLKVCFYSFSSYFQRLSKTDRRFLQFRVRWCSTLAYDAYISEKKYLFDFMDIFYDKYLIRLTTTFRFVITIRTIVVSIASPLHVDAITVGALELTIFTRAAAWIYFKREEDNIFFSICLCGSIKTFQPIKWTSSINRQLPYWY